MLRNINNLIGHKIHATDGELGKVNEFYFGDQTWNIRYMVVETGNWLLGRKVLISPAALKAPDWDSKTFPVALTREQVRTSPDIDTHKTVSRQHEIELQKHYAWGGYYAGGMSGGFMFPQILEEEHKPEAGGSAQHKEDTHLRGTRAVTGYSLHATDGTIGHVEDYIVDDGKWIIRYLVADAGLWLPGRKVLISPHWIKSVSWETSEVFVDLSRAEVSNSPEFDPSKPVDENYENALYDHYGRPRLAEDIKIAVE
ncbi:MAG: PRC-barrel domain-containing protein [Elusimicrobiota bacterium]|nr:PRC-barrel domain-containing protein [Elusimicrobiota bacterium]